MVSIGPHPGDVQRRAGRPGQSIDMGKDYSSATADLAMDPRVEDMLLEGTEFWTVKPSISWLASPASRPW